MNNEHLLLVDVHLQLVFLKGCDYIQFYKQTKLIFLITGIILILIIRNNNEAKSLLFVEL